MQKGRSMVEMLGVLIIITVLTIGALAGWKGAQRKMDTTETQNEIALIEQDISNLFNWARAYPASPVYCKHKNDASSCEDIDDEFPCCGKTQSFMATLCSEKVFPSGCTCDNTGDCVAYHPFDRAISKKAGTYGVCFSQGGEYLVIELRHLPSTEVCNELLVSAAQLEHYEAGECTGSDENMVTLTLTFR